MNVWGNMRSIINGYVFEYANIFSYAQSVQGGSAIVIVSYKNSWGEVDYSLPILYSLKHQKPQVRIVAVIELPKLVAPELMIPVLFNKLREIADVLVYPVSEGTARTAISNLSTQSIKYKTKTKHLIMKLRSLARDGIKKFGIVWSYYQHLQMHKENRRWKFLFSDLVKTDAVRVILEDHTRQSKFQKLLRRKCKNARVVIFPHATSLYIREHIGKTPKILKKADCMILSSDLALDWARDKFPAVSKFHVTGFSRYDAWWIEKILIDDTLMNSMEISACEKFNRVFTFFTHDIHPEVLPVDMFEYLVRSVCDVVFSNEGSYLFIKPHPRQDIQIIKSILKKYPANRWSLTNLQALQASSLSDFVISMWSSTILDALAVGKPVIEFFDHTRNTRAIINSEGKHCSEYGYMKLSIPASTAQELDQLIRDYFSLKPCFIWEEQKKTAKEILQLDNNNSNRAAKILSDFIDN